MQQLAPNSSRCLVHNTASCSGRQPAAAAPAPAARWGRRREAARQLLPVLRAKQQHPEEGEPLQGDSGLQDSLVRRLQFEIGKKRVDEFVENESEGLRQKAEDAKQELDKLADLQNLKAEVAFNSALADINREADEFEEQLRKSREQLEASEKDFEAWQDDVAVARSQGQFFQTLYQTNKKRPVGMSSDQLQERAQRVAQPAKSELGSWVRYYLFAFLAFVLAAEVVLDLQSDAPSALQDVVYTVLIILMGWTAYNERKSLL